MKNIKYNKDNGIIIGVLALFLLIMFSINISAQHKTEVVGFKVRTSSPGGNFSPKNIGAIWIEDANGNFIKTLKRWAQNRKQYLYTWNNKTAGNDVDAVTSATLSSHQTHQITWNLTDVDGNAVPNGEYTLRVEMTDQHAQGPLASYSFPVGDSSNVLVFPDETYFHDIQLYWNSITTDLKNENEMALTYKLNNNFPNPYNPSTIISYSIPENAYVTLNIYNLVGEKIKTLVSEQQTAGNYIVNFDAASAQGGLTSGIYFYSLTANDFVQTKKMMLLR